VIVAPIGSPEEAIQSVLRLLVTTPPDVAPLIADRPRASHKGSFGHVLVLGGSLGKAGAAAMCGMAVLRVGAGLSTVATPKSTLPTVAAFHPEVMTEALEETEAGTISMRAMGYGHVDSLVEGKAVLAIGPGISHQKETVKFVRAAIKKFTIPTVLDADGLNAFEGHADELKGKGRSLVITPHPGEMARLLGSTAAAVQRDRLNIARAFAQEHELIVVLKGHRTLVANPDGEIWVNTTGNPGMATGGTGDILTGMIAGLIAQNPQRIFEAVVAAVFLHGLAGDVACEASGEQSLVATDLLAALPQGLRRVRAATNVATLQIGA
jgi:NAD(P)H-hydrate epimerase